MRKEEVVDGQLYSIWLAVFWTRFELIDASYAVNETDKHPLLWPNWCYSAVILHATGTWYLNSISYCRYTSNQHWVRRCLGGGNQVLEVTALSIIHSLIFILRFGINFFCAAAVAVTAALSYVNARQIYYRDLCEFANTTSLFFSYLIASRVWFSHVEIPIYRYSPTKSELEKRDE